MVFQCFKKKNKVPARGLMGRFWAKIVNTVLDSYLGCSYEISADRKAVSFRHCKSYGNPSSLHSEVPIIWLHTRLGINIPAAFLEKEGATKTILFSHGNAEDMGDALRYALFLQEKLDVNIFVYEYTGFGHADKPPLENRVRCTEQHIYADIMSAYGWLLEHGVKPCDIVLFGRGLGSGPSVELAATEEVGGLVLIAAMASVLRVAAPWLRFTIKRLDMFTSIDKMQNVKCPVLSLHGQQDRICTFSHAKSLFEAAPAQATVPFWPEAAAHEDVETVNWNELCRYYEDFLMCISTKSMSPRWMDGKTRVYTFEHPPNLSKRKNK